MSDEKTLLPELLPTPSSVIPSIGPRERVARHWQRLVTTGAATAALAGCGCLVMDPMPPPALCRTTSSVLGSLAVAATPSSGSPADVEVSLNFSADPNARYAQISLNLLSVDGGQLTSGQPGTLTVPATLTLTPASAGSPITLVFGARCAATTAPPVQVVVTPQGLDGGPDAGPATAYRATVTELGDGGR